MTTGTAAKLLANYKVDEPSTMVLDRMNQMVRIWLTFHYRFGAEALSLWVGLTPIYFETESRCDVEEAHPDKCVLGIRFRCPLQRCIPAIRENQLPIDIKVDNHVVLRLLFGASPVLITSVMSEQWE